jgi:hypothetical protein
MCFGVPTVCRGDQDAGQVLRLVTEPSGELDMCWTDQESRT